MFAISNAVQRTRLMPVHLLIFLFWYSDVQAGGTQPAFRRNITPPFPESKSKPGEETAAMRINVFGKTPITSLLNLSQKKLR
jgi:hypothetical protein